MTGTEDEGFDAQLPSNIAKQPNFPLDLGSKSPANYQRETNNFYSRTPELRDEIYTHHFHATLPNVTPPEVPPHVTLINSKNWNDLYNLLQVSQIVCDEAGEILWMTIIHVVPSIRFHSPHLLSLKGLCPLLR